MKSRNYSVLVPEHFKQLERDGVRFEALVCQLLEAMSYRVLERPAIGPEGGRDVLVERTLKDAMGERHERVVIQCKHHAHSGKAVRDADVGVWRNAMTRHRARGYLLVTDTKVTENLSKSFREFTNDETNSPNWAAFWDVDQLIAHLNRHPQVRDSFFEIAREARTPLDDLAEEVRTWLRATRYEVSTVRKVDGGAREMLATFSEGSISQQVLVRCIGGEISKSHVDQLDSVLDRKTPQGWLISDKRIAKQARARADQELGVKVFTLSEFLRQMIWGKYFNVLTGLIETERIASLYVDPACYKLEMDAEGHQTGRDERDSVDTFMDEWLAERGTMHISLLGEFGAGKTWFCRHYAYRQLQRFLKEPAKERLPLLITLRLFAKAMTAQQLINDALLEQYGLPFVGSAYDVFSELNRQGKLLLILDGFDEMARQVDYQTVVDNFWELAKLAEDGSKVILTSRTEYFRWAKESEKILRGEEYGRRTIVLEPPKFEVLYLQPFTPERIRELIELRLGGETGPPVADRILGSRNLAEMASKPVLVELLLSALDEVKADVLESPSQVYLYATNKLLLRNISAEKTFTSTADKLYFLCELAWEMLRTGDLRIHYTVIPERIRSYFGDRIRDQHELDNWDFDLRAQTLLHRDAVGYYEFAHKSLAEYFVALKFAAELGCLHPSFAQTYREADGQPCEIPIETKDVTGLSRTFGLMALSNMRVKAVRDLMQGMMSDNAVQRLWDVVDETKGKTSGEVSYVGGNAASLLSMKRVAFDGRNLANTVLNGVSLAGKDLRQANLSGATFRESSLQIADLRGCDLTGINLDDSSLIGADLREATGLQPRFFPFASEAIPRIEHFQGREAELSEIEGLLGNKQRPSVCIITGRTGVGKSVLLAAVAQRHQTDRPVCWYSSTATRVVLPKSDDLFRLDDFYGQMATFITIAGYDGLTQFLVGVHAKTPGRLAQLLANSRSNKRILIEFPYDKESVREINTLLLPAFKKERWLICIDDIFISRRDERFEDFLSFFAEKGLSTKIIATTQAVPEKLAQHALVIQLDTLWR